MKRHIPRLLALCLLVCFLAQTASAAVLGGVLKTGGTAVAAGLGYSETTYWSTAANGRQTEHYYTYTPNGTVTPMVFYGDTLYGRSTLDDLAPMLEATGRTIVAAVNGSFFEMANGVPQGLIVTDGVLRSSGNIASVGFRADGTTVIGEPGLTVRAQLGEFSFTIHYNKALSTTNGMILYSGDYDHHTKNTVKAYNVVLEPAADPALAGDDALPADPSLAAAGALFVDPVLPTDPASAGDGAQETVETTAVRAALPLQGAVTLAVRYAGEAYSAEIPEGCFVLSMALDAPYASTLAQLQSLQAGDTVTIQTSCDAAWQDVLYACGGGDMLVENGQACGSFTLNTADKRTARTAVGLTADGSVVVYTVDGLQTGYSLGVTLGELAARMVELGCVTALNLDGGGSTTVGLRSPGYDALETVNRPTGGEQRKCANFICFTMPTAPAGPAAQLFLYPNQAVALPGAELTFTTRATDADFRTAAVPEQPAYTASLGSVSGSGVYTATEPGTATIEAFAGGAAGTATVTVIDEPAAITIWNGQTNATGTTVAVGYGASVDFSAQATYSGFPVSSSDRSFVWTVSDGLGTLDENGVFTANGTSLEGTITVSRGAVSTSVQIRVTDPDDTPPLISMRLDGRMLTAQITDDLSGLGEITLTCDDLPVEYGWDGQTLTAEIGGDVRIVKLTAADRLGNRAGAVAETGLSAPNVFADMEGEWSVRYVAYLNERGVLQGSPDANGTLRYNPSNAMTRQDFITALIRWLGVDVTEFESVGLPFADADAIAGYALPSMRAAYALGYLTGASTGGELYALPTQTLSRQDAMAILGRSQPDGYAEDDLTAFADAGEVADYARSHIAQMVTRGVIAGANGLLDPRGDVTRAQVAKMLYYLT